MRSRSEVEERRDILRNSISDAPGAVQKEEIREQIFALDRVLGLFDTGVMKDQFEIFRLLQDVQTAGKDSSDLRTQKKTEATIIAYKWVLKRETK